jgi:hypothetical protein
VAGRFADRLPWLDDPSVPSLRKTGAAVMLAASMFAGSRVGSWVIWGAPPTVKSEARVTDVTPIRALQLVRTADATRDLGARLSAQSPLETAALAGAIAARFEEDVERARSISTSESWPAKEIRAEEREGATSGGASPSRRWPPVVPLDADALRPDGPRPHVIFASETLGDYLLWQTGREKSPLPVRLICYSHVHLFTEPQWARCMQVKLANRGWQETLDTMGADVLVLEEALYSQDERKKQGKSPGFSNLIDRVRAAGDRWEVISAPGQPLFIAQRRR